MFISETVKIFFNKHKEIIKTNNFTELYRIINNEYNHDNLPQTDRTTINEMLVLSGSSVLLLGNLKYIPDNFLFHSTNVETINIPEGIKEIPYQFAYKSHLRTINLPSTLIKIGESAFMGCKKLSDIYYSDDFDKWSNHVYPHWDAFYWCKEDVILHCTDGDYVFDKDKDNLWRPL